MMIEPMLLGYFLFCNVNLEGITCTRVGDKDHNQKAYVSQYEIQQGNMIITVRNNLIYNMHWKDIDDCKKSMTGYAKCIFIPLPNS